MKFQDILLQKCLQGWDESEIGRCVSGAFVEQIMASMSRLSLHQRAVLSLRCLDAMSFNQIARIQQRRAIRIRLCFTIARRRIRWVLFHQGFSKNVLPEAIGLFGRVTTASTGDVGIIDVNGIKEFL